MKFLKRMLYGVAAFVAAPFIAAFSKEKDQPQQLGDPYVELKTPAADVFSPRTFWLTHDGKRISGHVHWDGDQAVMIPDGPLPAAKDGMDAQNMAKLLMADKPEAIELYPEVKTEPEG